MNNMGKIADMLGVEMYEEFEIRKEYGEPSNLKVKLTNSGLMVYSEERVNGWYCDNNIFASLLTGLYEIIKKPWKPKKGDVFYAIYADSKNEAKVYGCNWDDTSECDEYYVLGNCFPSKEEANQYKDKYISWLKNKEPNASWRD